MSVFIILLVLLLPLTVSFLVTLIAHKTWNQETFGSSLGGDETMFFLVILLPARSSLFHTFFEICNYGTSYLGVLLFVMK